MKVSVVVIAYNQVKTISKTLDGIISQKTNFPFEVIVNDDASNDGTKEIIEEYAKKYPELIKPVYHNENQFSKKVSFLEIINFDLIKGEYFAFCEGDDYWVNDNKLQIQVDFLDNNPDFSGVFLKSKRKNIVTNEDVCFKPTKEELKNKTVFGIEDTVCGYFIETCTVMYRWQKFKKELKEIYPDNIVNMDTFFIYFFSIMGKIKYIDELAAVKTINENGIWNSTKRTLDEKNVKFWLEIINFPIGVRKLFDFYNYSLPYEMPEGAMRRVLNSAINIKRFDIVQKAAEKFPEVFKKLITPNEPNYGYYIKKIRKYKKRNLLLLILCIVLLISLIISIVL